MSGLLNSSLNRSTSNLPDSTGRPFTPSLSGQSGSIQGFHNIHESFNVPNMPGTFGSRNTTINNVPSSGVHPSGDNFSSGRFASNSFPDALSQISASHGHSGMTNRGGMPVIGNPGFSSNTTGVGGSVPGILPNSPALGNQSGVQRLGV